MHVRTHILMVVGHRGWLLGLAGLVGFKIPTSLLIFYLLVLSIIESSICTYRYIYNCSSFLMEWPVCHYIMSLFITTFY